MKTICSTLLLTIFAVFTGCQDPEVVNFPEEDLFKCAVLIAKENRDPSNIYEFLQVVEKWIKNNKEDEALHLLDVNFALLKTLPPDEGVHNYKKVSLLYNELGKKEKVEQILDLLLQKAKPLEGWGKNRALIYATEGYAEIGNFEKAIDIVNSNNPVKNSSSTNPRLNRALPYIANCYIKAGKKAEAIELLDQAYRTTNPNYVRIMERTVNAYLNVDECEKAYKVASKIKETYSDAGHCETEGSEVRYKIISMIHIANKYADIGDKGKAKRILSEATQIANRIDYTYLKTEMLKNIAVTYAGAGKYQRTGSLSHMCCGKKFDTESIDTSEGIKLAKSISQPLNKSEALRYIGMKLFSEGDKKECLKLLSNALNVTKDIKKEEDLYEKYRFFYHEKYQELIFLADDFIKIGKTQKALEIFDYFSNNTIKGSEYFMSMLKMAKLYYKIGNKQMAKETLEKAQIFTEKGKNHFGDTDSFIRIAAICSELGFKKKATDLINKVILIAKKKEKTEDCNSASGGLCSITHLIADNGDFKRAKKLASVIKDDGFRDLAFFRIGKSYVKAGRYEDALESILDIKDPRFKFEVIEGVIENYPKPGEKISDKSRKILHQIITQTKKPNEKT